MLDFHSHFEHCDCILNNDFLLPAYYSKNNENQVFSSADWHIGEIGLDRRFELKMPLEEQCSVFENLLKKSNELNLSVSVHSVGCTEKTIKIIKNSNFKPWKILWHGFNGSSETALELFKIGVIISIGPRFNGDLKKVVSRNPMFVLESDYTGNDLNEYNKLFSDHCNKVIDILGISLAELEEHCNGIAKTFKN